jgi:hypothetical protein
MIINTTTVEAGFVRLGETIVIDSEDMFILDSFEIGPEAGEVSFFTKGWGGLRGERYIFGKDQHLQVLRHAGQCVA